MTPDNEYQKTGLLITLEGIEGAGKSTCLRFIHAYLKKENIQHIVTREPGGTALAEAIRKLILRKRPEKMHEKTELLLLFAARAQHITEVILPALQAGKWVISDRFTEASYAYQGGGRGLSEQKIAILEQWVQESLRPTAVLLLDLPVKEALSRIATRKSSDRIEQEKEKFFDKVRTAYLRRAHQLSHQYYIINASEQLVSIKKKLAVIMRQLILTQKHGQY